MKQLLSKRTIIIIGVIVAIIATVVATYFYLNPKNPNGEYFEISNLEEYLTGKEMDEKTLQRIEHALYTTVAYNVENKLGSNSVKDVIVRDKTFSQTYDEYTDVYTTAFIVDIESLRQSYGVSLEWTKNSENMENIDQYGTLVSCLPIDELKYGDFKCVDDQIFQKGVENSDPIQPLLPYHERGKYKITDYEKDAEKDTVTLEVEAYTPAQMYRLDQATLDSYTKDIQAWLESRKLDPAKYDIHYIY